MKRILWLVSWFPNRLEPLSGDFIERHARAASMFHKITVLFVVKDHKGVTPGKIFIEKRKYNENLDIVLLYYKPFTRVGLLERMVSGSRYFLFFLKLIREYFAINGKPDFVHAHIGYKAGLAALYCKLVYGIKYMVSEHWTVFCPEAKPGFRDFPWVARRLTTMIYRNAFRCSAVSEYLGRSLANLFRIPTPVRIPNVVDTRLFFPAPKPIGVFRFIHISTLNYQKNPEQMLEAVKLLKSRTGEPFELIVYGPHLENLLQRTINDGLGDFVQFGGEVKQDVLSDELRKSDALVLNSRFETFGCVIIEAYASGVPVIVSDIPVMREIVEEGITGVFVKAGDATDLAEKMFRMMQNRSLFNSRGLAELAEEKYGMGVIARQFDKFYQTKKRNPFPGSLS